MKYLDTLHQTCQEHCTITFIYHISSELMDSRRFFYEFLQPKSVVGFTFQSSDSTVNALISMNVPSLPLDPGPTNDWEMVIKRRPPERFAAHSHQGPGRQHDLETKSIPRFWKMIMKVPSPSEQFFNIETRQTQFHSTFYLGEPASRNHGLKGHGAERKCRVELKVTWIFVGWCLFELH